MSTEELQSATLEMLRVRKVVFGVTLGSTERNLFPALDVGARLSVYDLGGEVAFFAPNARMRKIALLNLRSDLSKCCLRKYAPVAVYFC